MATLTKTPPHLKLRDPMGRKKEETKLRGPCNMQYILSFTARVRINVVANNTSQETEKIVAVKQSNIASFLVTQRVRKVGEDGQQKKNNGAISQFPIARCIKITPWSAVENETSMAIHFEKDDQGPMDIARNRSSSAIKDKLSKKGRTKVSIVHIHHWTQENVADVKKLWEMCNEVAQEYRQKRKAERRSETPRIKSGTGTSIIDEKVRLRERNRVAEGHRGLSAHPRTSASMQSQGHRMMAAMASNTGSASKGRYSSLIRGAKGERSYSKSLIGSPDLKDFDPKTPVKSAAERRRNRIEEVLSKRTGRSQPVKPSVFPSPSDQVEIVQVKSPAVPRKRRHDSQEPQSEHPPKRRQVTQESRSPASRQDRPQSSPEFHSPDSYQRRRRPSQDSPEGREKRSKFMSQQLQLHKESSEEIQRRKRLEPFVQNLLPAAGIANEGNTCYLSAVIQALMSDSQLISCLGKRVVPEAEFSFSSALVSMAKGRGSSTTLGAGKIRAAISKHFPEFSSANQQDAHEFLLRCLDVVATECTLTDFRESPTHTNYSLVQEQRFTCTSCGHRTSPRKDILRGLSLDIPEDDKVIDFDDAPPFSIKTLLENFFSTQELDLNCEKCTGKRSRSESKVIVSPRVLVLHIKRFGAEYDATHGDLLFRKITDSVHVPQTISLDSFLSDGALCSKVIEKPSKMGLIGNDTPREVTPTRIDHPEALSQGVTEKVDLTEGPVLLKSQVLSQMSQVQSPVDPETDEMVLGESSKKSFVSRRFRIHAEESQKDAGTCMNVWKNPSVKRKLQLDDDEIEDDICQSPRCGQNTSGKTASEILSKIIGMGLPKSEAEIILQKAKCDLTVAMGLAMDRKQEIKDKPIDLDGDLLKHISKLQNGKIAPCDQAKTAEYKLGAVIRHHSDSMENGHYLIDILQRDDTWFCYDDSHVSELKNRSIQHEEGYLCWYMLDS